ncbi:MAG: flagellar basal body-associated FliL family protein [Planctomycetes bacterium]|nr:flagellar basal body-associated FliL family protein [Planctomycetota bacterium]
MVDADSAAKAGGDASKDGAEAAAPPSALNKLFPFIAGGALSVGLGVTAGIVTQPEPPPPEVHLEAPKPVPTPFDQLRDPKVIPLPTLIVNLADTSAAVSGKLIVFVQVRCKDEKIESDKVQACEKGGASYPAIRDALITLMSGKQSSDLKTPRGKEQLKLELHDKLNPILFSDPAEGTITAIYFDEFLVQ